MSVGERKEYRSDARAIGWVAALALGFLTVSCASVDFDRYGLSEASEKPELKYRVTLLNSPAINAFALPGGTLYVTRGLVALANDTSELSSVLAHEMAHVIARHAAIREDQVRQAMIV